MAVTCKIIRVNLFNPCSNNNMEFLQSSVFLLLSTQFQMNRFLQR